MRSTQKARAEIAQVAARLIAVDGISDFRVAKRKAAVQLGLKPDRFLPTNQEIEQALVDYQRLFQAAEQPEALDGLRRTAAEAMAFLAPFRPRLVGPVLTGTATRHSEITLHVFCGAPEEIQHFLEDRGIPATQTSRTVRIRGDGPVEFPAYRFIAGDATVVLVAFDERQRTASPVSPVDGGPLRRARLAEVEALLDRS
jgi:hypothetical protein